MNRLAAFTGLVIVLFSLSHTNVPSAAAESLAARTLESADAAYREGEWQSVATLYRDLAAENPAQGAFWYRLATAEYNLKQYDEAIAHYQRAIAVGFSVGSSYYNAACCHALMGNPKAAVDALDLAIRNDFRQRDRMIREDADFVSVRDTPDFRERILPAVTGLSRAEGWRVDLEYLTRRVAETHYDPFRHISREEWDREIARISKAVPKMKDHEVVVALMQLLVRINDGHTAVFAPREGPLAFHSLPLEFFDFEDGLFVVRADPKYAGLVGKRVTRIGDLPAGEAFARVATVSPRDNTQGVRWLAAHHLGSAEVLNALGVTPSLDGADITAVAADGSETRMTVAAASRVTMHGEPWDNGWTGMLDPSGEPPLWRRNVDKNYWFEALPERGIVYAGFNSVRDQEDETLDAFSQRLFAYIDANPVEALVVDVRMNNGGNNTLARSFMLRIVNSEKINRRGRLFVIIGRETFSACQNFCNWLDRDSNAIFVGEPTGSRPNFVGEGNEILLPYSGITVNASSRLWQDSFSEDQRHWIAPHISALMTSQDYRSNRDPAMDAILEYLAAQAYSAR